MKYRFYIFEHDKIQIINLKTADVKTSSSSNQHSTNDAAQPFFTKGGDSVMMKEEEQSGDLFFNNVQAKLNIGAPNDPYEQEADAIADSAIQKISNPTTTTDATSSLTATSGNSIQRMNADPEGEEVQMMEEEESAIQPKIQLKTETADEDTIQRMPGDASPTSTSNFESNLASSKGGGSPLSSETNMEMGNAIGADFSNVRVHTDSNAVQMNKDLGAKAFTNGSDIYFNEGNYDTQSIEGKRLLAHELTHTVQQGAAIQMKRQISTTGNHVQALGGGVVRRRIAGFANRNIPAYPLLSVIIGYDIIAGEPVPKTRDNILRGAFSLINPIGSRLFELLLERGIIDQAFNWVNTQLDSLGLTATKMRERWDGFWDGVELLRWDVVEYNKNRFREYFGPIFRGILNFVRSVGAAMLRMLKEAFLKLLSRLAKALGGYDLLCALLGYDPVTGEVHEASTADILRGILRLPVIQAIGGDQLLLKLEEHGLIEKTALWLNEQWALLKGGFADLRNIATKFVNGFTLETLFAPMEFVNSIKDDIVGFVTKVITFFGNIAEKALELIKEVSIWLLKQFVDDTTPGFHLVKVVLGRDPLTGEAFPRTAENIVCAFLMLLPGGETLCNKLKESGAIAKAVDWVMGAIQEFTGVLGAMKEAFIQMWQSSSINDLFEPIAFFMRLVEVFTPPVQQLLAFVTRVLKKMFELLLQIMKFPLDIAQSIIANIAKSIDGIKADPVGFLLNLLGAVKQGFSKFFDNIGKHLIAGVTGWLFAQASKAGVAAPQDLSLGSIFSFVLDILGVTVDKLWEKLAERIGQERVDKIRGAIDKLQGVWTFVKDVMTNGISAIWSYITEKITGLWDMVVEEVQSWVITQIIQKVVTKLLSMLDPTGIMAVINGFIAFFKAIQSFIEYFKEMLQIVNTFVGGLVEIAYGTVSKAADFLENALGKGLKVALGFLANQVGLGDIGSKLGEIIQKIRGFVDSAISWLIDKAMRGIRAIMGLFGGGTDSTNNEDEDLPYDDPEKSAKVAAGLADISILESPLLNSGKLSRADAEQVAHEIKNRHSVFKVFRVIDGGESWDYYFEASPGDEVDDNRPPKENIIVPERDPKNFSDSKQASSLNVKYIWKGHGEEGTEPAGQDLFGAWAKLTSMGLVGRGLNIWVRFHILSEQTTGTGVSENLIPTRKKMNEDYRDDFERVNEGLVAFYRKPDDLTQFKVLWFKSTVTYGHSDPFDMFPSLYVASFGLMDYDNENKTWSEGAQVKQWSSGTVDKPILEPQDIVLMVNHFPSNNRALKELVREAPIVEKLAKFIRDQVTKPIKNKQAILNAINNSNESETTKSNWRSMTNNANFNFN